MLYSILALLRLMALSTACNSRNSSSRRFVLPAGELERELVRLFVVFSRVLDTCPSNLRVESLASRVRFRGSSFEADELGVLLFLEEIELDA